MILNGLLWKLKEKISVTWSGAWRRASSQWILIIITICQCGTPDCSLAAIPQACPRHCSAHCQPPVMESVHRKMALIYILELRLRRQCSDPLEVWSFVDHTFIVNRALSLWLCWSSAASAPNCVNQVLLAKKNHDACTTKQARSVVKQQWTFPFLFKLIQTSYKIHSCPLPPTHRKAVLLHSQKTKTNLFPTQPKASLNLLLLAMLKTHKLNNST